MNICSVIIPTYKRADDLASCLNYLAPGIQNLSFDKYEVIVSDDEGDGSQSEAMVQKLFPWAKWVSGPGQGPAANRNNGTKYAKGDWLVFIDDDCLPDENWLAAIWNAIYGDEKIDVIEGKTIADRQKPSTDWESPINEHGGKLWTCNLAIRKSRFDDLGGFDEGYPFAAVEDIDFRKRIRLAKLNIRFLKQAIVIHPWRRIPNFKVLLKKQNSWQRYYSKFPEDLKAYKSKFFFGQIYYLIKTILLWTVGKIGTRYLLKKVAQSINSINILRYKIKIYLKRILNT